MIITYKFNFFTLINIKINLLLLSIIDTCSAQKITTVQMDGVQYYISRMNPYSTEMNYFMAYQYCRSLGYQLISFETKEKADTVMIYLKNAGFAQYDFWTSGNNLGNDMLLWMSTGLPFNTSFTYVNKINEGKVVKLPHESEPKNIYDKSYNITSNNCIAIISPNFKWTITDCMVVKDFICEQALCNYNGNGNLLGSSKQGNPSEYVNDFFINLMKTDHLTERTIVNETLTDISMIQKTLKKNVTSSDSLQPIELWILKKFFSSRENYTEPTTNSTLALYSKRKSNSRYNFLPIIKSIFVHDTNDVLTNRRTSKIYLNAHTIKSVKKKNEEFFKLNNEKNEARTFVESTIGPYDSTIQDYQADESEISYSQSLRVDNYTNDDTSTALPEADSSYKYFIKVRNNGKVLHSLP